MAIIDKISEPGPLIAANNDNYYIISSSLYATRGFQYIADIHIDTISSGSLITTLKAFPHPNTTQNSGIFNLKTILPPTLSFDFSYTLNNDFASSNYTNLINTCPNSLKKVAVTYGFQNYTSSINQFIISRSIIENTNSSSFWNASLDWFKNNKAVQTSSYLSDTYSVNRVISASFLTNSPRSINTYSDMRQWLYFIVKSGGDFLWNIKTYNSNGTQLSNITGSQHISESVNPYKMFRLATGPIQLNNYSSSFINTNIDHYTVQLISASLSASVANIGVSEIFTYNLKTNCSDHKKYVVHWLNTLGGFDSFYFNYKSVEIANTSKQTYNKNYYDLTSIGGVTVNNWNAGDINYYISNKTNLSLSTDFVDDNTAIWLKELFISPVIFIENIDTGNLVRASVNLNSYEIKKAINNTNKVFSITLEFQLGYTEYSQLQ